MAWISVHGQLRDHSKTRKLAKLLGVNREEAMGILLSLWLWGIDNADRDGFIVDADGIDIEEGINAHVQPAGKLIDSLVKSRWVDIDESGLYCIHDWDEWQESWYTYIDRKRKDAERKRNERRQKSAARPGDSPMDVPVDCPMDRPRTVTRTVTGTVQTSPNVTIPNQTVIKPIENEDDEARARACTRIREISRATTTPTAVTLIHDIESDKKLMPDFDRVYMPVPEVEEPDRHMPVPAAEETDRYMPVLVGATESASESDVSAAPDIHARWAFNVLPVADVTTEMNSRPEPEIQPIILREFMPQNPVGGQPAYGGVGPPGDMEAPVCTAKTPVSTTESTSHGDTNTSSRGGKNTLSDRHEAASPLPPVIQFDAAIGLTLNDGTTHFVTTAKVNEWQELYPAVEIMAELRKMKGWINENPKRRKTKQGIGRFIVNWLSREQDRKGGGGCGQGGCGYGHGAGDGWKHSEQTGPRVFVPSTGFRGW